MQIGPEVPVASPGYIHFQSVSLYRGGCFAFVFFLWNTLIDVRVVMSLQLCFKHFLCRPFGTIGQIAAHNWSVRTCVRVCMCVFVHMYVCVCRCLHGMSYCKVKVCLFIRTPAPLLLSWQQNGGVLCV